LCWEKEPSDEKRKWDAAPSYCSSLGLGGGTDWRLPNIDELKSLLRGCQNGVETEASSTTLCTMSPEGCIQVDSCAGNNSGINCNRCDTGDGPDSDPAGCYWDADLTGTCGWYWSSTIQTSAQGAWYVDFNLGYVEAHQRTDPNYVRCVHSDPTP
jgi:hypothetical protein